MAESGEWPHDLRQQQVVAGDSEQAETDDEQAGDRARLERDVERRLETVLGRSCGAHVRADGDVHADEAGRGRETGADEEAEGAAPAELVVEAEQQERDDRDERDGRVLLLEVGGGALLHGARDLLHALVACRPAHQPQRQVEAVQDRYERADECEENSVVLEEHRPAFSGITKSLPTAFREGREPASEAGKRRRGSSITNGCRNGRKAGCDGGSPGTRDTP